MTRWPKAPRRTLVDVFYSPTQQKRLRTMAAGRGAMHTIRGLGNLAYADIILERKDFERDAGVYQPRHRYQPKHRRQGR